MPKQKPFDVFSIKAAEIDEMLEEFVRSSDYDDAKRECDHIFDQLLESRAARMALEMARQHINMAGPEHLSCGLRDSISAFFIVACRLMERRYRAAPEVDELERLFSIEPGVKPDAD